MDSCPGRSAARSDALQTRDRRKLGRCGGPGSAVHRFAAQSSLRGLRKLICAASRCTASGTCTWSNCLKVSTHTMSFMDTRQWIALLEKNGELRRIAAEVDWNR